jgi:hypothetical protein
VLKGERTREECALLAHQVVDFLGIVFVSSGMFETKPFNAFALVTISLSFGKGGNPGWSGTGWPFSLAYSHCDAY